MSINATLINFGRLIGRETVKLVKQVIPTSFLAILTSREMATIAVFLVSTMASRHFQSAPGPSSFLRVGQALSRLVSLLKVSCSPLVVIVPMVMEA